MDLNLITQDYVGESNPLYKEINKGLNLVFCHSSVYKYQNVLNNSM